MESTNTTRNIIILGGSVGAIGTAHYLLKHVIQHLSNYKVVLVSPNAQFVWRPACPRAAVSDKFATDSRLFTNMTDILKQYPEERYRWLQGLATSVDASARTVCIQTQETYQTLSFDALVVATGASTTSPLLGLTGDEIKLRDAWRSFQQAVSTVKTIVVAGGGPAGVELAGELGALLNRPKGWFRAAECNVAINLVTSAPQILPHLRPSIAQVAEVYLAELGVTVQKNARVKSVTAVGGHGQPGLHSAVNIMFDNGSETQADLYVPATGTMPNTNFMHPSLLAADGRIQVDPSSLKVENTNAPIYAVGDASTYARPTIHAMFDAIPAMCSHLKHDLLVASGNTDEAARGMRAFKENISETQFVPIGVSKGVGVFLGYRLPSWVVYLAKGRDYMLWASSGIRTGNQWSKE